MKLYCFKISKKITDKRLLNTYPLSALFGGDEGDRTHKEPSDCNHYRVFDYAMTTTKISQLFRLFYVFEKIV